MDQAQRGLCSASWPRAKYFSRPDKPNSVIFLNFSDEANLRRSVRLSSRAIRVFPAPITWPVRPLYGSFFHMVFQWYCTMILILMILLVMMIRLQQSVFLTSTTKGSVYTARNFAVRHYVILGHPFMYLPFGARSIAASDWDLFFCIRSNMYGLYHRYRLCFTSNNLPGNSEPMFVRNCL